MSPPASSLAASSAAPSATSSAASQRPPIRLCPTAGVALAPTPIERSWLLDGMEPRTEAATLAASEYDTLAVYLWQTTRAHYRWEHRSDEVVTVLAGECFIAGEGDGAERRLGVGDVAFFPAGSRSVWRVPEHLRKVSTLVRPLPRPAARALRLLRSLRRRMKAR